TPNSQRGSNGSAARGALISPSRRRRGSPSSADSSGSSLPEAVLVHERGDLRILLFGETPLECREDLVFFHPRVLGNELAELTDRLEPRGIIGFHLSELVQERLDVAMLTVELVRFDDLVGLAQRWIDDHLFLMRMLVEHVRELHQHHAALPGLTGVGRE